MLRWHIGWGNSHHPVLLQLKTVYTRWRHIWRPCIRQFRTREVTDKISSRVHSALIKCMRLRHELCDTARREKNKIYIYIYTYSCYAHDIYICIIYTYTFTLYTHKYHYDTILVGEEQHLRLDLFKNLCKSFG